MPETAHPPLRLVGGTDVPSPMTDDRAGKLDEQEVAALAEWSALLGSLDDGATALTACTVGRFIAVQLALVARGHASLGALGRASRLRQSNPRIVQRGHRRGHDSTSGEPIKR